MALVKCPKCGEQVSSSAKKCPHCGYKQDNIKKRIIIIASIMVACLIIFVAAVVIYPAVRSNAVKFVIGYDESQAKSELQSKGYNVSTKYGYSDSQEKGHVFNVSATRLGNTVEMYVSNGPEKVSPKSFKGIKTKGMSETIKGASDNTNVKDVYLDNGYLYINLTIKFNCPYDAYWVSLNNKIGEAYYSTGDGEISWGEADVILNNANINDKIINDKEYDITFKLDTPDENKNDNSFKPTDITCRMIMKVGNINSVDDYKEIGITW